MKKVGLMGLVGLMSFNAMANSYITVVTAKCTAKSDASDVLVAKVLVQTDPESNEQPVLLLQMGKTTLMETVEDAPTFEELKAGQATHINLVASTSVGSWTVSVHSNPKSKDLILPTLRIIKVTSAIDEFGETAYLCQ